jgi:hypothetical protein
MAVPASQEFIFMLPDEDWSEFDPVTGVRFFLYHGITASRSLFLPPAAKNPVAYFVVDDSGLASATKTITVVPNGTDTAPSSAVINTPNGYLCFASDDVGAWNTLPTTSPTVLAYLALYASIGQLPAPIMRYGPDLDGNVGILDLRNLAGGTQYLADDGTIKGE